MNQYSCTRAHYAAHLKLHEDWSKAKGQPDYNKAEWVELARLQHARCQGGCLANPPPIDVARGPLTGDELAAVLDPESDILDEVVGAEQGGIVRAMATEIQLHRDTMAPHLLRATRLYTDELGALRKRVAELEQLHDAAARANDALESIGDQTGALLREVLELYNAAEVVGPTRADIARIGAIGQLLTPPWVPSWERPESDWAIEKQYARFVELRDELLKERVCLACGTQVGPGERSCQCENDE